MVGFKYKMSNIQAAIGCAQIERIDELVARKREIMAYYREHLERIPGIHMNPEYPGTIIGAWMPTVVFAKETGITREFLVERFHAENIDARVFFWPLSSLPMFEPKPKNINAWDIPGRAINLPSYHDLSQAAQDRIINIIKQSMYSRG